MQLIRNQIIRKSRQHAERLCKCVLLSCVCVLLLCACGGADEVRVQSEADILLGELKNNTETDGDTSIVNDEDDGGRNTEVYIVIHILGAVERPGVYEVSEGSRVADVLELAGGYTPEACLSWLNQARLLEDGEQIYVPTEVEVQAWTESGEINLPVESGAMSTGETKDQKVDINRATVEELMNLPGIGEAKARSIVDYRQQNGKFACIEDLMLVPGIKEGVYNQIKEFIQV